MHICVEPQLVLQEKWVTLLSILGSRLCPSSDYQSLPTPKPSWPLLTLSRPQGKTGKPHFTDEETEAVGQQLSGEG